MMFWTFAKVFTNKAEEKALNVQPDILKFCEINFRERPLKNKIWRITLKQKVLHNCKKIEDTNFVVRATILCERFYIKDNFHLTFS